MQLQNAVRPNLPVSSPISPSRCEVSAWKLQQKEIYQTPSQEYYGRMPWWRPFASVICFRDPSPLHCFLLRGQIIVFTDVTNLIPHLLKLLHIISRDSP